MEGGISDIVGAEQGRRVVSADAWRGAGEGEIQGKEETREMMKAGGWQVGVERRAVSSSCGVR